MQLYIKTDNNTITLYRIYIHSSGKIKIQGPIVSRLAIFVSFAGGSPLSPESLCDLSPLLEQLLLCKAFRDPFIWRSFTGFYGPGIPHGFQHIDTVFQAFVDPAQFQGHSKYLGHRLNEFDIVQRKFPGFSRVNPQTADQIFPNNNRYRQDG
jgi:hypothetical protein